LFKKAHQEDQVRKEPQALSDYLELKERLESEALQVNKDVLEMLVLLDHRYYCHRILTIIM